MVLTNNYHKIPGIQGSFAKVGPLLFEATGSENDSLLIARFRAIKFYNCEFINSLESE